MVIHYDSIFLNENNEYAYIKDRMSPITIAYITRLKQHVPNVNIYFYGSITNFTFFNNNSDIDICITYPDEYVKTKIVQFITEKSLHFHINKIKFQQLKFSRPTYLDEFDDVYHIYFDHGNHDGNNNKSKIDINIISNKFGPVFLLHLKKDIIALSLVYIVKWLYYYANIISKDVYIYLKNAIYNVDDRINNISVFRSKKQVIECAQPL